MNATLPEAILTSFTTLLIFGGVGYWIFCMANGTPNRWKLFLLRETNPEVRLKWWRSRVLGYFILAGVILGYSISNTFFLLNQKPNVNGLISTYDAGSAITFACFGGIVGAISGGVFGQFVHNVPGDVRPDEDLD